jgi:tetratricopeptide (TPR) repeat protein
VVNAAPGSEQAPRRFVGCDRCGAGAWIGPRGDRWDAWCEACQRGQEVTSDHGGVCSTCGATLTLGAPRFEELYGELQCLVAVLEAWSGDAARLATLVPERPRFLTDLDPPEPHPAHGPEARAALAALKGGAFAQARAGLEALLDSAGAGSHSPAAAGARIPESLLAFALGIARQRLGDLPGAEEAFNRALSADPDERRARLDRGALRARRGDFAGAREDLERAGGGREAAWNRAALIVLEAVAGGAGLPDARSLEAARAVAGPPSSYWSDHTVGRLLFTLVAERARVRGLDACADARTLRAAERELEFETFDDRALALLGYAGLGLTAEAERVAAPLSQMLAARLGTEPSVAGSAGRWLAAALATAEEAARSRRPHEALAATRPLLERADLRHYRFPCAHCGAGTIGVERVEEADPGDEASRPLGE